MESKKSDDDFNMYYLMHGDNLVCKSMIENLMKPNADEISLRGKSILYH